MMKRLQSEKKESKLFKSKETQNHYKQHLLNIMDVMKQCNKSLLIDKVLDKDIDFKVSLDAVPGRVQLINLMVKNPFDKKDLFRVEIDDPHMESYDHKELSLVNNLEGEW